MMTTTISRYHQYSHNFTFLLFLCTTLICITESAKQLVLFAGPHQAAATSVERFYHNFASGYNGAPVAKGLKGWIWPLVRGNLNQGHDLEREKIWSFLVTNSDDGDIQETLHKSIKDAWLKSQEGVILGTEEFDRIGENPSSHYDGLEAMLGIVNRLHVENNDVWVVFNYRKSNTSGFFY